MAPQGGAKTRQWAAGELILLRLVGQTVYWTWLLQAGAQAGFDRACMSAAVDRLVKAGKVEFEAGFTPKVRLAS